MHLILLIKRKPEMKITKVPRMRDRHKKRVAAYCRVSTKLANQEESFETQVAYYTSYIKAHTEWEFAGIYFDEKSAAKVDNRPGFRQLIQDALDEKVDYILVKSISRFSRNIVDCQNYVNMLRSHGCYIHFEKEGLDTEDPAGSMMFSFLSVIAQDESRSISDNVRWSYRERYRRGEYNLGNNRVLGYDCVGGRLVPNEDAWVVCTIYQMFLHGNGEGQIAALLEKMGVHGRSGRALTAKGVRYILSNEVYVGDRLLQKQPPKSFLTKRSEKTIPYESHYLMNDHEAIVDINIWNQVQNMLHERAANPNYARHTNIFYGQLFCGECGAPLKRRTLQEYRKEGEERKNYKIWACSERLKGCRGNGCKAASIREETILREVDLQLGLEWNGIGEFPAEDFKRIVKRVDITKDKISVERLC
jgi:DNA invertase Pin-like site-specific DNA recombinase